MIFTDDQKTLQDSARHFSRKRLLPEYQKREKEASLDRGLLREMGHLGLLGMDLPESAGGMGLDGVTTGMLFEEVAYGDFNMGSFMIGASLNGAILIKHAHESISTEWLPRLTSGEAIISICLTEPRGGSDASNLQVKARPDSSGGWILNGEKTSISFADRADAYLVFARTGTPEEGAKGVSAFFIPATVKGISHALTMWAAWLQVAALCFSMMCGCLRRAWLERSVRASILGCKALITAER